MVREQHGISKASLDFAMLKIDVEIIKQAISSRNANIRNRVFWIHILKRNVSRR